jgi:2-methylcitrate dehydratase PrpD
VGHVEERIAEFIVGTSASEVPKAALKAAQNSVFDCVGCILAAAAQPHSQGILRFVQEETAAGESTVIGTGLRTSRSMAALANGTLAHWLDYDDGRTACGHAASVLLPAALAIGEPASVSGRELLTAYAIGLEAATHISDACPYEEKVAGFHRTSLFGTLGATATAARLLGLNQQQTVMALGIAGSTGTGVCQNFGTYTKPLHAGSASRNAVTAARLAGDGWTGSDDIFAGPLGWAAAYVGHYNYEAMAEDLGAVWRTAKATPMIKKYPCCGASHGPLDSLLSLMAEHGFTARDVAELEVGAPYDSMVMIYREPASGFQGKFSLLYSIATALVDGHLDVDSFQDAKLARQEYAEVVSKIKINVTSKWDTGNGTGGSDHSRFKPGDALPVIVRLRDGRTLSRSTARIAGLQTPEEMAGKFRRNAARTLPPDQVDAALECWASLNELPDIREAMRAAAGAACA